MDFIHANIDNICTFLFNLCHSLLRIFLCIILPVYIYKYVLEYCQDDKVHCVPALQLRKNLITATAIVLWGQVKPAVAVCACFTKLRV